MENRDTRAEMGVIMGGLDFKEPLLRESEEEHVVRYNTRLGLILFAVYCLFYGGFMFLSAFHAEVMSRPSLGGVNFSVVSGFVLIALARILALGYRAACRRAPGGGR